MTPKATEEVIANPTPKSLGSPSLRRITILLPCAGALVREHRARHHPSALGCATGRWSVRPQSMSRVLTIILALSVVAPPAAGTSFRCRYDGRVRNTCCCKHSPSSDASALARLSKADCCDVFVQTWLERAPATAESATRELAPVLRPLALASAASTWTQEARAESFPGRGPPGTVGRPVFLQTRSLLL